MLKKIYYVIFAFALALSSCGSGKDKEGSVSASEIEKAHIAGREAARAFLDEETKDTLQLQTQLIEAGAKASVYDSIPRLRSSFDSAFISTIKTVRPDIADVLEKYRKENLK